MTTLDAHEVASVLLALLLMEGLIKPVVQRLVRLWLAAADRNVGWLPDWLYRGEP